MVLTPGANRIHQTVQAGRIARLATWPVTKKIIKTIIPICCKDFDTSIA